MSNISTSSETPRRRASDRIVEASVALVPVEPAAMSGEDVVELLPLRSTRHDPSFLTHLIAIAERCPQTRVLRRATPQDAMAAYRAVDAKGRPTSIGGRTRQDI